MHMQTALNGICAGFPQPDNHLFWISLFMGLGIGCASVLAALTYFVAIVKDKAAKGEVSGAVTAIAATGMLILAALGFFAAAVAVRVIKLNVPDTSGLGLGAFAIGLLVTLTAHIRLSRQHLKF
jgi:hypothetical protein